MAYRVTTTPIYRPDGRADVGDVIEPTDAELRAFGDNLERVSDDGDADESAESARTEPDTDTDADDDANAICGATLSSGGTCDRPAATCPYHNDDDGDGEGE